MIQGYIYILPSFFYGMLLSAPDHYVDIFQLY